VWADLVPVAITAPLLIGLGVPAVRAAVIPHWDMAGR
jgi:hypothetical protein